MDEIDVKLPPRTGGFLGFLASGAIWYGLFALVLALLTILSYVLDWRKVTNYYGRRVDRIELRINTENGGGSGDLLSLLFLVDMAVAVPGFLLGLIALVGALIARRRWFPALLGVLLNVLAVASPFAFFFIANRLFGYSV